MLPAPGPLDLKFGPYAVDLRTGELLKNGTRVRLQEKPLRVLALLAERQGDLVTREELKKHLWPEETFVDFEAGLNTAVKKLRGALSDDPDNPRYIETIPRRGYRFLPSVEVGSSNGHAPAPTTSLLPVIKDAPIPQLRAATTAKMERPKRFLVPVLLLSALGLLLGGGVAYWFFEGRAGLFFDSRRTPLTEKDTVVLADFDNKSGDPVFDDTLKQALAVELGQSPFLNILSDRIASDTIRTMGRPANERITADVAREICLRTGSKAQLAGTISSLGSHYLVSLKAIACSTGDTLANVQGDATGKEDVLRALSRASSSLRAKLGESLPSVQKFDVPFNATTTSLEALKSYNLGHRTENEKGYLEAIPFMKRAIELDPNFPGAYAWLANAYTNSSQPTLALEYATKAYQWRDRTTELEKLAISANYFNATGEIDKEIQTYELWIADYPRASSPHTNLAAVYNNTGQYAKALAQDQEAVRLEQDDSITYGNLGWDYLMLNRLDEAKETFDQGLAHKLDGGALRAGMYFLGFLRNDTAQMEQQLAWGLGKPGDEDSLLSLQSDTEAYYGRLRKARDFSRRAVDTAVRAGAKETAALWRINAALREAELGNRAIARQGVSAALALSEGRDTNLFAALALAKIGDTSRAKALAQKLEKDYPTNTFLKDYWLPSVIAAIEISERNWSHALMELEPSAPYELAAPPQLPLGSLYPVYLRGQVYLGTHNGGAAAAEFQKLLDHRGVVGNSMTGALAHLYIARAQVVAGDTPKAKAAYQDFFALWKDADPDLRLLKQAKAEYANLK